MSETYTNQEDIRRVYQDALASFVEKVQRDRYVVAAILYGSLAYDDVWEKSDIDIILYTGCLHLRQKLVVKPPHI